jgi:hypothetical protein
LGDITEVKSRIPLEIQGSRIQGSRIEDSKNKLNKTILDPRNPRSVVGTESIANYLVDKFNAPTHYKFFLKVAWRLDERRIHEMVEAAFDKGTNPRAYFIKAVKNERGYSE